MLSAFVAFMMIILIYLAKYFFYKSRVYDHRERRRKIYREIERRRIK